MSDEDRDGRRTRLRIILLIAAVIVLGWVTISIIGSRQVNADVADVRAKAGSMTVDPSTIAFESYGAGDNTLAKMLGVDPTAIALRQGPARQWCVTVEISHLASSRSVHFQLDDTGVLSEIDGC